MKPNTLFSILLLGIFFIVSCSSSSSDDEPEATVPDPSAATLVFPEDGTECNTGVITSNENLSTVTFEWNASENTDSYTVTVTNLDTESSQTTNVTTNEASITILRGVPFSWFVTSRAQGTSATANSATFQFYNEGPGVENYTPFPAQVVSPVRGINLDASTTSVTLEWTASDLDNDIIEFEVLFGTDATALPTLGSTTDTSFPNVEVEATTVYYWKIVTTDAAGNTSTSELFEFRVG